MAESHVVSALVAKRAELAGLIQHHRKEIERISADLGHIDASIKIFAPETDLRTIGATVRRARSAHFSHGETSRVILDALRVATTPLTSRAIVDHFVQTRGLNPGSEDLESMQKSVCIALKNLEAKNLVRPTGDKSGKGMNWQIA